MEVVRAAGGFVYRRGDDGTRLLLVHRPRYDDWTFPKGKAANGEADEECALREVLEETGFHCALEDEVATSDYVDSKGRPKRVRYWRMHPVGGEFAPTEEVDEIRWCTIGEAANMLSYPRDVELLGVLE